MNIPSFKKKAICVKLNRHEYFQIYSVTYHELIQKDFKKSGIQFYYLKKSQKGWEFRKRIVSMFKRHGLNGIRNCWWCI